MLRLATIGFILILLFPLSAKAQNVLSSDRVEFVTQVKELLGKYGGEAGKITADEFEPVFNSLSLDIQEKVMKQTQSALDKRYRMFPLVNEFYKTIINAKNFTGLSDDKMVEYLLMTEGMYATYKQPELLKCFKSLSVFFEHRALNYASGNKLYVREGDFSFEFIGAPPEPDPVADSWGDTDTTAQNTTDYNNVNWDDVWNDPTYNQSAGYTDPWGSTTTTEDPWGTTTSNDPWGSQTQEPAEPIDPLEYLRPQVSLPVPYGAVVHFTDIDLNVVTYYDSVFVKGTSGFFNVNDQTFTGDKGTMDFAIANLSPDSVYAELAGYTFRVQAPDIRSVDAMLTYKGKLEAPIEGIFQYKRARHDSLRVSKYPQFLSYRATHRVSSLAGPDMTYTGGFSLEGAKILSKNFLKDPSRIEVLGLPGKKFVALSNEFVFGDSIVTSPNAAIRIIHNRDSIYHPSVRMHYKYNTKELILSRADNQYRNVPYVSSYFNMNILTEEVDWKLDTDSVSIHIRDARAERHMVFESVDHYQEDDFVRLRSLYDYNPLLVIAGYADRYGLEEFNILDLSFQAGLSFQELERVVWYLDYKGLLKYDQKKGTIKVSHQALTMVRAYKGLSDYDGIIIESIMDEYPGRPNATLFLKDERIEVNGVEYFQMSDSLNVQVEPDSSHITILKNRDILFDGKISAGNFEYTGKDFLFKYDSFKVNLGIIEQLKFYTTDSLGRRTAIDNSMVGLDSAAAAVAGIDRGENSTSGTLYINDPTNKSGIISYPNYPNFNAGMGGVIYFDRPEIFGGRYDKSIFFVTPPFKIDSLSDSDPSAIVFDGKFASGGMFPVFEEKLEYQKDNSLGFQHEIPEAGYQLFEGQGKLFGDLSLNKKGLRSNGQIDYLSTSLLSDDFLFYPDSVVGKGAVAEIRQEEHNGVIFPQADLSNYRMRWVPRRDSLYVYNTKDPFQFYNGSASLDGVAIIAGNGVYGKGTLISRGSFAESDRLTFRHDSYSARNADFKVQSSDPLKPALAGTDVRLNFNLNQNFAEISPEIQGEAAVEFPYAQFRTSIPSARWDLNTQKIYMKKPDDIPIENSYFYTTNRSLDSLRFNATEAVYDINTLELTVSGIPYIIVADARITPQGNQVKILENARIGTLRNTVIILDTLTAHHRLYDGVIDVKSRNEFSGYATYELVNAIGDTFAIKMTDFRLEEFEEKTGRKVEKKRHTVANGKVEEAENILMSPGMYFKGDVKLEAHRPILQLDGFLKLNLTRNKNYNTWIHHNSDADQSIITIDFDNSVTDGGRKLDAGLYFSALDNSLYSLFVDEPRTSGDEAFFRPSGDLYFDEDNLKFVIETPGKSSGKVYEGQLLTYDDATGEITFEGLAEFFKPTKQFSLKTAVIGQGNIDSVNYSMNAFIAVDFDIPKPLFDIMALDLEAVVKNLGAPDGLGDPTELLYKVASIMGEKAAREYEQATLTSQVSLGGFSPETTKSMVFSDVNLSWSEEHKAFYSEGLLGMSNIFSSDINAGWEGFLEVKKNEDGMPAFNLFFKASRDSWYFFSFQDNRLMTFSSVAEYNDFVTKKTNAAKAKLGDLVYIAGTTDEVLAYVNRFRLDYLGIDSEYDLDSEAQMEEKEKKKKEVKTDDDGF